MSPTPVLITGGIGGIGQSVAQLLSQKGYFPIIAHRPESLTNTTTTNLGYLLPMDLGKPESVETALLDVTTRFSNTLAVIVCAAAPPLLQPFGKINRCEMVERFTTEICGHQQLISGLVKNVFRKHRRGAVIGVLSQAMGSPIWGAASNMGSYTITKHAMEGLLALLAADYTWLKVDAVRPGFVDTNMLSVFDKRFLEKLRADHKIADADLIATEVVNLLQKHCPI
jgi:3-oxoacyl-[acyl-carrier protein] reductase